MLLLSAEFFCGLFLNFRVFVLRKKNFLRSLQGIVFRFLGGAKLPLGGARHGPQALRGPSRSDISRNWRSSKKIKLSNIYITLANLE